MRERSKIPVYMKAPMTARTGELFAYKLGYENTIELADSLPPDARVLDVGAGKSDLGRRICDRREDVQWTNADIRYFIPGMIDKLSTDKPANLRFVPADVLRLTEIFPEGQFDRVYSFWLLPHIGMASHEASTRAARNMLRVASSVGEVVVGPCWSEEAKARNTLFAVGMDGQSSEALDGFATEIATATTLPRSSRVLNYLANVIFDRFEGAEKVLPEYLASPS